MLKFKIQSQNLGHFLPQPLWCPPKEIQDLYERAVLAFPRLLNTHKTQHQGHWAPLEMWEGVQSNS